MSSECSVLRLISSPVDNRMNRMGIQTDNHSKITHSKITLFFCFDWFSFLPDTDTVHIGLWTDWHMSFRKIDRRCNQGCSGRDQCFYLSCIVSDFLHSGASYFHYKYKLGLGNRYNHQGSWYYMDNLKKFMAKYLLILWLRISKNRFTNQRDNRPELFHNHWDSLYQSKPRYNRRNQVGIGLRILLRYLGLWKHIIKTR